jgi:N-formylglutamate amidohydrolase
VEQFRDPAAPAAIPASVLLDVAAGDAAEAAYVLIEPLRRAAPLVFASPHSGRRYPRSLLNAAQVPLTSLRRGEDAYVDELFAGAAAHGAPVLCAAYARAYVDLNRDPEELDQDMFGGALPGRAIATSPRVQAGLGAIPRIAGDGREIYRRKLPVEEAAWRIERIHRPYHATLAALIDEAEGQFGCAVLIDCHSMPSGARGPLGRDIVLGDRYGAACHPAITALVEATLSGMGYSVARNAPFAGGHSTQIYGQPANKRHALQIEINRALYVDERSFTRTQGFQRVRADMTRLAEALAAAEFDRSLG